MHNTRWTAAVHPDENDGTTKVVHDTRATPRVAIFGNSHSGLPAEHDRTTKFCSTQERPQRSPFAGSGYDERSLVDTTATGLVATGVQVGKEFRGRGRDSLASRERAGTARTERTGKRGGFRSLLNCCALISRGGVLSDAGNPRNTEWLHGAHSFRECRFR